MEDYFTPRCTETWRARCFHTVPIFSEREGRPPVLTCTRCGLPFVEDPDYRQGYRPAPELKRRSDAKKAEGVATAVEVGSRTRAPIPRDARRAHRRGR